MAAVQQNITYKRELHAGDTVVVRSAFLEVRENPPGSCTRCATP
jgi:acyl-CoA thioesterase FadM